MAISFSFGTIKLGNLTLIRNEINRLRVKHGLASVSFPATTGFVRSADMTNVKDEMWNMRSSQFITDAWLSPKVATVTGISTDDAVKETEFNTIANVLNNIDGLCVHHSVHSHFGGDYGDYSDYDDYGDYSHDSVQGSHQSYNADQNIDVYWDGMSSST